MAHILVNTNEVNDLEIYEKKLTTVYSGWYEAGINTHWPRSNPTPTPPGKSL
jgi:hypothetical protein